MNTRRPYFSVSASLAVLLLLNLTTACSSEKSTVEANASSNTKNQPSLAPINQGALDELAKTLDIKYRFLSNIETDCPNNKGKEVSHCYSAEILLTAVDDLPVNNWQLNFSQVYPAYASSAQGLTLQHLNGDIHQITPTESFQGFSAEKTQTIKLWVQSTLIGESELMPNYWLSADNLSPRVVQSTKTKIDLETGLEVQPYVVPFEDFDKQIKSAPNDINEYASPAWLFETTLSKITDSTRLKAHLATAVIPTPDSLIVTNPTAKLDLSSGIALSYKNIEESEVDAALNRLASLGVKQNPQGVSVFIETQSHRNMARESYQLTSSEKGISIVAADNAGAFYALQTLAGLLTVDNVTLPYVKISDAPRYGYRGQHIDVARNFHSKALILSLIEQMAAYKLNKLHLHLAEDEGWRLALPSFPELTQIGSQRCMDLSDKHCMQPQLGGAQASNRDGFYTVADYKEILKYAKKHHIEVIPSLDMPGHSRAAIKAMEARYRYYMQHENEVEATRYLLSDFDDKTQYSSIQNYNDNTINICMESAYAFVDRVLEDLIQIHKEAEHPLNMYHIGADETAGAWLESPVCKALIADKTNEVNDSKHLAAHFIERVSHMVSAKGIAVGGWNDGLAETQKAQMPTNVYSYIWGALPWGAHQQVSEQARRNWHVVLSIPDVLYFDFPYQIDPKERGYHWASRRITSRNIFNFMPDNLPVHAEFRLDTLGQPYAIDDRVQKNEAGEVTHQPLPKNYSVAGVQGQLWSETIRSEAQAQYMIFPRMLVLAERAWHKPQWEVPYNYNGAKYDQTTSVFTEVQRKQRDLEWQLFSATLGHKEIPKLERADIFYRIPTVGAKIIDDKLHMNILIDGFSIEYQDKGGRWTTYENPVLVTPPVSVRARSFDKERVGRTTIVE